MLFRSGLDAGESGVHDLRHRGGGGLVVAVLRTPRLANADDLDPLAAEPGVTLRWVQAGEPIPREARVVVIAGSQKGKSGKVLELLSATGRARIEGVAMIKRHLKKSQEHPQGTIAEREGSIHVSNLMLQAAFDASKRKKAPAAN